MTRADDGRRGCPACSGDLVELVMDDDAPVPAFTPSPLMTVLGISAELPGFAGPARLSLRLFLCPWCRSSLGMLR